MACGLDLRDGAAGVPLHHACHGSTHFESTQRRQSMPITHLRSGLQHFCPPPSPAPLTIAPGPCPFSLCFPACLSWSWPLSLLMLLPPFLYPPLPLRAPLFPFLCHPLPAQNPGPSTPKNTFVGAATLHLSAMFVQLQVVLPWGMPSFNMTEP